MKCLFIFFLILNLSSLKAQTDSQTSMDVRLHGYIFTSENGFFFQPLDFDKTNIRFTSSLNKKSFSIFEGTDMDIYSDVIKAIGDKLYIMNYDSTRIKKRLVFFDTIKYVKCILDVSMAYFDTACCTINDTGFGFAIGDKFYTYGNLDIFCQIYRIIPDERRKLNAFYNYYINQGSLPPKWLSDYIKGPAIQR
jgi:hypothetical protein